MIRDVVPALIAVSLALGIGVWSAERASSRVVTSAERAAGSWYTLPKAGAQDANPYVKAHLARSGDVPLGSAEGHLFFAITDDDGEPLIAACDYLIEGRMPAARLWTLHVAADRDLERTLEGIHSRELIYTAEGTLKITVSRSTQPLNWMRQPLPQNAPFRLSLTLYDSAITGAARLNQLIMPSITRVGCADA